MGLAGKSAMGIGLFRSNSNRDSLLQQVWQTRMDAAQTRAPAFGDYRIGRSSVARVGRFPVSNRIDSIVRGNLPRCLLGKHLVASEIRSQASRLEVGKIGRFRRRECSAGVISGRSCLLSLELRDAQRIFTERGLLPWFFVWRGVSLLHCVQLKHLRIRY